MARIAGEVTIESPVEEVFDLVADERNEPGYNRGIIRAEKVTAGPVARARDSWPSRRAWAPGRDDAGDRRVDRPAGCTTGWGRRTWGWTAR